VGYTGFFGSGHQLPSGKRYLQLLVPPPPFPFPHSGISFVASWKIVNPRYVTADAVLYLDQRSRPHHPPDADSLLSAAT
jgi:hypothetical protein